MGDDLDLAWVIAGLVSVVALALALRAATEGRRTAVLRDELEEHRKGSKSGRRQQEQRDKALRRAESELEKATRKLAQADKRVAQAKESAREERSRAADRIRELESQAGEAAERAELAARDLERARAELDASVAHVARAESRVRALEQAALVQPPPADPEELRVLRERAESSEQKLGEKDDALDLAIREVTRLKDKARIQETLYTSIRSELSLKKDQIRQQRAEIERLQATKVSLGIADRDEPTA